CLAYGLLPPSPSPSSPPRRSSDLLRQEEGRVGHLERLEQPRLEEFGEPRARDGLHHAAEQVDREAVLPDFSRLMRQRCLGEPIRSEEHTSELQSLTNLVCPLLP